MGVLPAFVSVYHMWNWCLWRLEEGVGSPETNVADGMNCHVSMGNLTQVFFNGRPVLLTAEPPLQPEINIFEICCHILRTVFKLPVYQKMTLN